MAQLEIQKLSNNDYGELSALIASDTILQEDFGIIDSTVPDREKVMLDFNSWCESHSGIMHSLKLNNNFVGLITLSKIDSISRSARLGLWLGSQYRAKGYGSQAIKLISELALQMDLIRLSGSVEKSNAASSRLWEKSGGRIVEYGKNNLEYQIDLVSEPKIVPPSSGETGC